MPVINPYNEEVWANLIDGNTESIADSLLILKGIHARWSLFLNNINETDLKKEYYHPENNKNYSLKEVILLYARHCNHHKAHIIESLKYKF